MGRELRLNLRILYYHLQITSNWKFTWTYNDYHKNLKYGWCELYEFNLFTSLKEFNKDDGR